MGLLDKIPFPRAQGDFLRRLFSTTDGHSHDGADSATVAFDPGKVPDGSIEHMKLAVDSVRAPNVLANTLDSEHLAEALIQRNRVTLAFADITTLNATPVALLPAPGPTRFWEIISVTLYQDQNDEIFDGDRNLDIGYDDVSTSILAGNIPHGEFHQVANDMVYIAHPDDGVQGDAALFLNQNVAITALVGEIGGNAAETTVWTIDTLYRVHDIS